MSIKAQRIIQINLSGDFYSGMNFPAADNANSPGETYDTVLSVGPNTIFAGYSITVLSAVTIIPPPGNTHTITLKGVAGDTGIALHLTDPTTIALDPAVASFILSVTAVVSGVRLIWT